MQWTAMTGPDLTYSQRAKPYSGELELTLSARDLVALRGKSRLALPLAAIRSIRLSYAPRNAARLAFRCDVLGADGPSVRFDTVSWKSMIELVRQDAAYRSFVVELIARAARANPSLRLEGGVAPWRHRLMTGAGLLVLALLAGAGLLAINRSSLPIGLASFGLALYFGWWLREYRVRNAPRRFAADAIPATLLPAIAAR